MNARWQDTPAAVFLRLLADLMIVNLLSLLCSLGVVTIGASLTAMYAGLKIFGFWGLLLAPLGTTLLLHLRQGGYLRGEG